MNERNELREKVADILRAAESFKGWDGEGPAGTREVEFDESHKLVLVDVGDGFVTVKIHKKLN